MSVEFDGQDAIQIFNASRLHVHVPPRPTATPPPSTSLALNPLSEEDEDAQVAAVDDWVTSLALSDEREDAFYGQSLDARCCGRFRVAWSDWARCMHCEVTTQ